MHKNFLTIIIVITIMLAFGVSASDVSAKKRKPKKTVSSPAIVVASAPTPISSVSGPIDLTTWKLTLPVGAPEKPTEIKQPTLSSYQIDPWFVTNSGDGTVRFRAPVNGVTTSGSGYPRSELREMTNNGSTGAAWTSASGTHTMFLDQAITALPKTKQHVVAGQIHDSLDDVLVIRLESSNLYVNVNGKNIYLLDPNYTLGKRFNVSFVVNGNKTAVYYNNSSTPVYVLDKNYSGAYFKAGAYTQSNCTKEAADLCNDNNFGEVLIYQVNVAHT